eukprot:GEMP01101342.1.p1 GENE.GEMP01101342.1~~GEMP01101342.1.p1  ORF type:complete len:101 (+),score=0.60 GEMP01101342.1:249-551(+)
MFYSSHFTFTFFSVRISVVYLLFFVSFFFPPFHNYTNKTAAHFWKPCLYREREREGGMDGWMEGEARERERDVYTHDTKTIGSGARRRRTYVQHLSAVLP